jgi:hypothetical protein
MVREEPLDLEALGGSRWVCCVQWSASAPCVPSLDCRKYTLNQAQQNYVLLKSGNI